MRKDRLALYNALEQSRKSKLLVYVTGDRGNLATQIAQDVLSFFTNHLDLIGDVPKISLFLYTRGGNTLVAWTLINLIRNFCKDFEVIVPFNCHSSGTLIALGANRIVMTKQATLGPIDPSINGPLNPLITSPNGQQVRVPVSVEFVNAYLEMAKQELKIADDTSLATILVNLSNQIHPLALGAVYRSKSQIQMLAKKLLNFQEIEEGKRDEIIKFLCSESGSHDYTMHRNEARELGLKIEKPDDSLYALIKDIYLDIEREMELNKPVDFKAILGTNPTANYSFRRAIIESVAGGCDVFVSEGVLRTTQAVPSIQIAPGQPLPPQVLQALQAQMQQAVQDNRTYEGWKHED